MTEHSFMKSGLRLGRIYNIDIWVHWTLLLMFAILLHQRWVDSQGWESIGSIVALWGAIAATILFHEFGHCYFAFRQGGGADHVILWPMGGLAHCDAPRLPWNQFWVAAGGPIFQLLPTAIAGLLYLFLRDRAAEFPFLWDVLDIYFRTNLLILGFNLIPIYPLDGGRMLQAILWGKLKNYGRATVITIWASRITILLAVLATIFQPGSTSLFLFFILFWALISTERLRARLHAGEEEDYVFGYDFSHGYTSLERTATQERSPARPSLLARRRARREEREQLDRAEMRRRLDELLEKISRDGMTSLSPEERKFLTRASKKLQRP